jgi:hypothetical protein
MRTGSLVSVLCLLALASCAQLQTGADSPPSPYAGRMKAAGDLYLACLNREAEKDMKNPTGADDIATAAHGRCWSDWEAYQAATNADFIYGAKTADEKQFGRDKAEAHLRQFEREARRNVVDSVVQRSLGGDKPR